MIERKPEFIGWACEGYSNTHVYRTCRINRLVEMFETGLNVLVHPSKWEDPYDNWVISLAEHLGIPTSGRRSVFGQCWSLSNNEEIHWKLYAPEKDGVMVRSTTDALAHTLRAIDDGYVVLGRVQYWAEGRLTNLFKAHIKAEETGVRQTVGGIFCYPKALQTVMQRQSQLSEDHLLKRDEFEFENEVRLLYAPNEDPLRWDLFSYRVSPCDMIDEITFDPRMSPGLAKVYEAYFRGRGFTGRIRQSQLYKLVLPHRSSAAVSKAGQEPAPIPRSAWQFARAKGPKNLRQWETLKRLELPPLGPIEIVRDACGSVHLHWNNGSAGLRIAGSRQELRALTQESFKQAHQEFLQERLSPEQIEELANAALSSDIGQFLDDDPFAWPPTRSDSMQHGLSTCDSLRRFFNGSCQNRDTFWTMSPRSFSMLSRKRANPGSSN